ncbi:MAG: DUF4402 domain-containing protein [Prolixibacteraceae bacterium]
MKAKIIIGFGIILLASSLQSLAQATAYVNIYAEVVAPIGITNTSVINSGEIVVSKNSATSINSVENTITASGIKLEQNGPVTLTSFVVTDTTHSTFDITLPSTNIAIGDGTSNSITVSNFNSNQTLASSTQGNTRMITIGADLNIPINQTISNYQTQNQYPVTFNYN